MLMRDAEPPRGTSRQGSRFAASSRRDRERPPDPGGAGSDVPYPATVTFRDDRGRNGQQVLSLAAWHVRPAMAYAVRDWMRANGPVWTAKTRRSKLESLKPFLHYLKTGPIQVDGLRFVDFFATGYADWVLEKDEWSETTKADRFAVVVDLLDHCMRTPHLAKHLPKGLRLPINPFSHARAESRSDSALSEDSLTSIRVKCIQEVREVLAKLKVGAKVRLDDTIVVPPRGHKSPGDYPDIRVRIRALVDRHDGRLNHVSIRKSDPGLARSFNETDGSGMDAMEALHFTGRTIVPFVLLLAIDTMFNPDTILGLEWRDIERQHPLFGNDRWRIGGQKARAHRRQYRSFSSRLTSEFSTVNLLLALEEYGAAARRGSDEHLQDRVFAFRSNRGKFRSYEGRTSLSGDSTWEHGLEAFRKAHALPHFTLKNIRRVSGSVMLGLEGGDLKAQQEVMQHASADTTYRVYRNELDRVVGREKIAGTVDDLERFASTRGKSDPRRRDAVVQGQGAVTPGFLCADPRRSPIPGQREGKLCDAFGACPSCGNAEIDFGSARSLGRLRQLRECIQRAAYRIHPDRWFGFWQPQLLALDALWIGRFDPDLAATCEDRRLPSLPPIE